MRAVVVLPTPRTPVSMKAWAMRPSRKALVSVLTIGSWPIRSAKRLRPILAGEHAVGRAGGVVLIGAIHGQQLARGPSKSLISAEVGNWHTTRAETR